MKKIRLSVLLVSLFAALTLLSGCEKKEAAPAATPATTEAPAAQPMTPAEPAAPAEAMPAEAAPMEAAPMGMPQADAAALPESCEAYLVKIQECVQKNAENASVSEMLKQQEAQMRESWTQTADKDALDASCKQAAEIFAQNAAGMGC